MDMHDDSLDKRVQDLRAEMEQFRDTFRFRHLRNYWLSVAIVVGALLAGAATSLAGFTEWPKTAGTLGLILTFLIGIDRAFSLRERTEFQRQIVADAENLLDELRYESVSETKLIEVLQRFMQLRSRSAKELPTGLGIEAGRELSNVPGADKTRELGGAG